MGKEKNDERILNFFPIENDQPKTLTSNQIKHFNERGYIIPFDIYTQDETDENRRYFDNLLEEAQKKGLNDYSFNGYHKQCAEIWDIVTHPKILDLVEDLLGPNFVCWGTHYFCKLAHDPSSVPWHQDASYWPLSPSKTVTAWLAIDDADRANSAMKIVAGSHRHGHLDFTMAGSDEKVVLGQKVTDAESYGDVVYMELAAGQISLHSDLLIHGSDPNHSARRRCGLTMRYVSVDVRALTHWNETAVWCRGEDPARHWSNLPRPEYDST